MALRRLGILLPYLGNPFWHDKEAAYRQLAALFGFELTIRAPERPEPEAQAQLLETLLAEPCTAWIINPYTPHNLEAVVRAHPGQLMFDVGGKMASPELQQRCPWYLPVPTVDFVQQGALAGAWLAEQMQPGEEALLIPGIPGMPNSEGRIRGAEEVLRARRMRTRRSPPCHFKAAPAQALAQTLLATDRLPRAIFCANDLMALAVGAELCAAGRKEQVLVAGVDGIQAARDALLEGRLDATVAFYTREVAQRVLESVAAYLDQGIPPRSEPLASHLLTR